MIVFLDTEFTSLVLTPRLLSLGLVEGGGLRREFYAEVTDLQRLAAVSRFTLDTVVPQFGRIPEAACTYPQLCRRLVHFLAELMDSLMAGEVMHLAFGSDLDWQLLQQALSDSGAACQARLQVCLAPVNVFELTAHGVAREAAEAYLQAQERAAIARHHALCDARALWRSFEAARGNQVAPA